MKRLPERLLVMTDCGASRSDECVAGSFSEFVQRTGPRLKQSLIASLGGEAGRDATAEALTWAWEHWDKVQTIGNPGGYLYRLGRNRALSSWRRANHPLPLIDMRGEDPLVEPALETALADLSEQQRTAVLLIHGFGWTYREVADHLGVRIGTVQSHVNRGMARLRAELKVDLHA
jgi:RNA polymerase sigma-70 factor (ECF subfamily)